ncbi:lysoplasmalogenase [Hydrogenophaga sp. 5NK40-0174]|uniref:lysoplasmalogenase n=1 Tax=Hydrogenophaga sp. 5NK40-0174 TaxID=3127649 RepID=UPI0031086936
MGTLCGVGCAVVDEASSLLLAGCGLAVLTLVLAEYRDWPGVRAMAKMLASTAFLALAVSWGSLHSLYGQWIMAALVLGWAGDACLLGRSRSAFTAGLFAFLLSHLCFATAFASGPWQADVAAMGLVAAMVAGVFIVRWLGPHLSAQDRWPVFAYVAVILLMCAAAVGRVAAAGEYLPLWGALLFAASDIAVARERFVHSAWINRAWGLPTYYVAQILLAASVLPEAARA